MIAGVVVLTLLGLLLTGPGMWSERWGWKFLEEKKKPGPPAGRDGAGGAPPPAGRPPPPGEGPAPRERPG
jgi:hypothetical protein